MATVELPQHELYVAGESSPSGKPNFVAFAQRVPVVGRDARPVHGGLTA